MITVDDYFMGRDKTYVLEYKEEFRKSAESLLIKVNDLLKLLGIEGKVSSGWRPPSYNRTVKGAAKKSHHQTGHAVDIFDPYELIDMAVTDDLLEEVGLYREHPSKSPGWSHWQDIAPGSKKRTFFP